MYTNRVHNNHVEIIKNQSIIAAAVVVVAHTLKQNNVAHLFSHPHSHFLFLFSHILSSTNKIYFFIIFCRSENKSNNVLIIAFLVIIVIIDFGRVFVIQLWVVQTTHFVENNE